MTNKNHNVQDEQLNDAVDAVEVEAVEGEFVESEQELYESRIAELEAALLSSEAQANEAKDAALRARAEGENIRRRSEQEIDKARKYALNKFAEELLPVIDNLERALEMADKTDESSKAMMEGVELTLKTMTDTVAKFGLTQINPQGEAFNPEFHQAMAIQESTDFAPNTVMMVMQKGYELNGRVIRPAMVMVSKAAAGNVNTQA
ncbi:MULTISPECIES: nucleotide exchange factor GrpE [unclassified Photobacterium]|uniref:nucleotide exchange factor GrpE n=1 Tax=unclassified Photobacterium TaxID=2628852 RepID=UPI000D1736E5|nr:MULTISPECIES: nucleotide exchange factor GrpE [unclassified Photobacterium]MCG3863927.1 nucleotide exchange factor GrpE [Photobacterium sp. Ph6]MCG3875392.1 nucleotide exchange factor GrpE [Photobacterium sp. Ph5]PSV22268.1 nucleotide exchange factor GrpE [Photobacterium sp. GB-56]PSV30739.1 nucleotide exchange factor GrpE [Photobacterium sp. GB-27]PSV30967.1 nucleotide exchange factor GrpE [Photobacterium sp. GB-72]